MSLQKVYSLLRELGGRAFPKDIKRLAFERYPDASLHQYIYDRLHRLSKQGYVTKNPDGSWSIVAEYP